MMPPNTTCASTFGRSKRPSCRRTAESLLLVSKDDIKVNPNFSFLCDISEIEQAALEDINSIAELKHLLSLFRGDFFENCSLHNCENFLEYIIPAPVLSGKPKAGGLSPLDPADL